jgi:hypothetical protein
MSTKADQVQQLLDPGPGHVGVWVKGDRECNIETKHYLRLVRDGWRLRRVFGWQKPSAPEAA